MICVYPADCTDFSTNGNGTLAPLSAEVTETLTGQGHRRPISTADFRLVTAPHLCYHTQMNNSRLKGACS